MNAGSVNWTATAGPALSDVTNSLSVLPKGNLAKQEQQLVLTATGCHGQARAELRGLAEQIGASVSGGLVRGVTTHLVCRRLLDAFASTKYTKALEWGIPVVSWDWLVDSAACGVVLPLERYKTDRTEMLLFATPAPPAAQQCVSPPPLLQQQQPVPHACVSTTKPVPLDAGLDAAIALPGLEVYSKKEGGAVGRDGGEGAGASGMLQPGRPDTVFALKCLHSHGGAREPSNSPEVWPARTMGRTLHSSCNSAEGGRSLRHLPAGQGCWPGPQDSNEKLEEALGELRLTDSNEVVRGRRRRQLRRCAGAMDVPPLCLHDQTVEDDVGDAHQQHQRQHEGQEQGFCTKPAQTAAPAHPQLSASHTDLWWPERQLSQEGSKQHHALPQPSNCTDLSVPEGRRHHHQVVESHSADLAAGSHEGRKEWEDSDVTSAPESANNLLPGIQRPTEACPTHSNGKHLSTAKPAHSCSASSAPWQCTGTGAPVACQLDVATAEPSCSASSECPRRALKFSAQGVSSIGFSLEPNGRPSGCSSVLPQIAGQTATSSCAARHTRRVWGGGRQVMVRPLPAALACGDWTDDDISKGEGTSSDDVNMDGESGADDADSDFINDGTPSDSGSSSGGTIEFNRGRGILGDLHGSKILTDMNDPMGTSKSGLPAEDLHGSSAAADGWEPAAQVASSVGPGSGGKASGVEEAHQAVAAWHTHKPDAVPTCEPLLAPAKGPDALHDACSEHGVAANSCEAASCGQGTPVCSAARTSGRDAGGAQPLHPVCSGEGGSSCSSESGTKSMPSAPAQSEGTTAALTSSSMAWTGATATGQVPVAVPMVDLEELQHRQRRPQLQLHRTAGRPGPSANATGSIVSTSTSGTRAGGSPAGGVAASLQAVLAATIEHNAAATVQRRLHHMSHLGGATTHGGANAAVSTHCMNGAAGAQQEGLVTPPSISQDGSMAQQQGRTDLVEVELRTGGVERGAAAMADALGLRLAHLAQREGEGAEEVVALKLLRGAARGSTARERHGLRTARQLVYAECVQIPWAHTTLSTKERTRCAIVLAECMPGPNSQAAGGAPAAVPFVAEPVAFYQVLPGGDWWMEYIRLYTVKDLQALLRAARARQAEHGEQGQDSGAQLRLALPADYVLSHELLRGMQRKHCPVLCIKGEIKVSRLRRPPGTGRSRQASTAKPFFWRFSFDPRTLQVITEPQ